MDTPAFLNDTLWAGKIFNGDWIAADGGTHPIIEPATGLQLGSTGKANAQDVARAAIAARAAQRAWAATDSVSYTHLTLPTSDLV